MNKTASGRPIRFFALVMIGWVTVRLASPAGNLFDEAMENGKRIFPPAHPRIVAALAQKGSLLAWQTIMARRPQPVSISPQAPPHAASPMSGGGLPLKSAFLPLATGTTPPAQAVDKTMNTDSAFNHVPALPAFSAQPASVDRWHGSAWLLWRDGSATRADAIAAGRLGGSQAGVRIDFDLMPHARGKVTAYARASTALNHPASPEAALGLAWQPARTIPISIAAERRIALGKGARNANAVMALGGFGPTPVAPSLEVEAYAQGGMVGFRSNDFFVDGKMSLLSPIEHSPLRIGASLSGGAQPQVERLDIGPELQIRLPLKPVAARLGIEWRERIAGHAAPSSGLAVTLGADF